MIKPALPFFSNYDAQHKLTESQDDALKPSLAQSERVHNCRVARNAIVIEQRL